MKLLFGWFALVVPLLFSVISAQSIFFSEPAPSGFSSCPTLLDDFLPTSQGGNRTVSGVKLLGTGARSFGFGKNQTSSRIVGGGPPTGELRFYVVRMHYRGSFSCTGSIINEKYVMTAAHCDNPELDRIAFWFFDPSLDDWLIVRGVTRKAVHPLYTTGIINDVMVFELDDLVPPSAAFVTVNTLNTIPAPNALARIAGFGDTSEDSFFETPELRQVDVPCRKDRSCKQTVDEYTSKAHICAGYICGGCDACSGDSGGPLLQFDTAGYAYQIGITSYGFGCARPGYPGGYTRISTYAEWIASETNGTSIFVGGKVPQVTVAESACP